jgi:chorismate synthase
MLRFLTAGESHGPELVVIVEGMPAGVPIDLQALDRGLRRRQQGHGRGARSTKIEQDRAQVVSGLAHPASSDGDRTLTTGAPIAIRIVNQDFANQPEHPKPLTAPRPGHADLPGGLKYGLANFRLVRERASARETAARSAVGEIARALLHAFDVQIGSFVTAIGPVQWDIDLEAADQSTLLKWAEIAEDDPTRCPDGESSKRMYEAVDQARVARETLGGIFVVFALGLPAGLGSHVHWDRRLDGLLLRAIGSIPAVKGAEVGSAFEISKLIGSESVDSIKGADLERPTNRSGGVEGGITNGMPLIVRGAMKPLSSVRRSVESFDLATGEVADPGYVRSDICAVPAAGVVGEAMIAWVLADALCERFGSDRLDIMLKAHEAANEAAFVNSIWQ